MYIVLTTRAQNSHLGDARRRQHRSSIALLAFLHLRSQYLETSAVVSPLSRWVEIEFGLMFDARNKTTNWKLSSRPWPSTKLGHTSRKNEEQLFHNILRKR